MRFPILPLAVSALVLAACGDAAKPVPAAPPHFVKTLALEGGSHSMLGLSGTVRARIESPLAFQVSGRIASRAVDAGQAVQARQLLFELDGRDLEQGVRAAEADLAAAEAALATADADLARSHVLRERHFVSAQATERAQLVRREAQTRRDAAAANLARARNARGYGRLQAPAAGVLVDVIGEPGQVVAAGQPVGMLAHAGEREVEVYFPEGIAPPPDGEATLGTGAAVPLKLRETAGAVDAQGRTRRARYRVVEEQHGLLLGAVVHARFKRPIADDSGFAVPIGALDERGGQPRLWRFSGGAVAAVPVSVLSVDGESARVRGQLAAGDKIVAFGTHLLDEAMKVRELPR